MSNKQMYVLLSDLSFLATWKKELGSCQRILRDNVKKDTICALKDTHQKDKKGKDIPGGGETRSQGKISLE